MQISSILITYLLIWWIVWFMALPVGVSIPQAPEKGHASSAPVKARLWVKVVVVSLIAGVLTGLWFYLLNHGYINLQFLQEV